MDGKYNEVNAILTGRDRTINLLAHACAAKAKIMQAEGILVLPEGCQFEACGAAHVARIHFSRGELSRIERDQITEGMVCKHDDHGCVCHREYDRAHKPETSAELMEETIRGKAYIPRPMSG